MQGSRHLKEISDISRTTSNQPNNMNKIIEIEATELEQFKAVEIPYGFGIEIISEDDLRGLQERVLRRNTSLDDSKLMDALISYMVCNCLS